MQITTLEPGNTQQHQQVAQAAADVMRAGGLVVFPTETVYGVAAWALSDEGVDRLRKLKNADRSRAFTVHIPGPKDISRYAKLTGGAARRLASKAMPGPITLLIEVAPEVIKDRLTGMGLPVDQSDRIYHSGVVGLRCPDHEVARQIFNAVGTPVIATSANLPGERPPVDADQAAKAVGDRVGLVVDGGHCQYAKPSTIVRITGEGAGQGYAVEREGVYDLRYIQKLSRYTLLMVCSGNTCRSPMAQGIARQIIAKRLGLPPDTPDAPDVPNANAPDALEGAGVMVSSAGAYTSSGMPATPEAVHAVSLEGIDISNHRSTALTRELIDQADVIYCMTKGHAQAVLAMSPGAVGKTLRIDPDADIDDPIGAGEQAYRDTARAIRQGLVQRLKELPL